MASRPNDDRPGRLRSVPGMVRAAGIIWIIYGAGGAACGCLDVLFKLPENSAQNAFEPHPPGRDPISMVQGAGCGVLIAAAFAVVGFRIATGRANDTIVIGVISLVLGGLSGCTGLSLVLFRPGVESLVAASIVAAVTAVFLLIPGILALVGRTQYLAWRQPDEYGDG